MCYRIKFTDILVFIKNLKLWCVSSVFDVGQFSNNSDAQSLVTAVSSHSIKQYVDSRKDGLSGVRRSQWGLTFAPVLLFL